MLQSKSTVYAPFLVSTTGFPQLVFYFARHNHWGLWHEGSNVFILQTVADQSVPLSPFHFSTLLSLIIFPCSLIDIIYESYYLIFDLLRLFPLSRDSSRLCCDCAWHFNKKLSCADPKVPNAMCSESQAKHNRNCGATVNIQKSSTVFPFKFRIMFSIHCMR